MSDLSTKDFSFYSGERQTANRLSEIRLDHLLRYQLAKDFISLNSHKINSCLDLFCGNGYGTFILSDAFPTLEFHGIDGSSDAIMCANEYYSLRNNKYETKIFPFSYSRSYEMIVCFESLEHVNDDSSLVRFINNSLVQGGYLLLSVPNESLHSLELNPHPFHFRHYKYDEILSMFGSNFKVLNWYGQNTYKFSKDGRNTYNLLSELEMKIIEKKEGQDNIFIFKKND